MDARLNTYDWANVFGEGVDKINCPPLTPTIAPTEPPHASHETFGREDVELIESMLEGENDGPDWIIWGRLKDGRWFVARGGCDYTGWDCCASNGADVALTREDIIQFGMTEDERERFGVSLT